MMGITHHANYIRWMEEARIDFLAQMGYPYRRMEQEGIFSPVRSVSCQYRKPCTFSDEIEIDVSVAAFNGVVLTIRYVMRRDGEILCEGVSEHVFVGRDGRLLRMKRDMPEFCTAIEALAEETRGPDAGATSRRSGGETA